MLDTNPDHVSTHPENGVVLPKWKGDPKDKGLVAMIPFLECTQILRVRFSLILTATCVLSYCYL